ncbi:MAG: PDZ domain-containing protein [Bacillota bacterium]|nr:MAG: PDZ domain-containing protein [Bacillota bacterium]
MDFPLYEIARSVLGNAPQVMWNPGLGVRFVFYWAMAFFVFSQYRKTAAMQAQLYGKPRRDPLTAIMVSVLEGLGVGIVGSFVMTFFGVSFLPDGSGLMWVLGTALVLMAVNPRLMCFSYAGGLVSLSYLVLGFPDVSVPALMGLVAVLHLMESLLILFTGAAGATPVYLEHKGRQVGGFYLQRAWPVPVSLLILAVVSPADAAQGVAMPEWWPLLRTSPAILAHPGAVFFLHALPAALGYGDLAVTCPPEVKARRTARNLAVYSLVLLGLSVAATHYSALVWFTALFAPLAHEAIVRLGSSREMRGQASFVPPETGVMALDVVPGSIAARIGLGPGWVITEVGGHAVTGKVQMEEALARAGQMGALTLTARPPWPSRARARPEPRLLTVEGFGGVLGVIPVPEPGDDMGLGFITASPIAVFARKVFGKKSPK